jgi:hypothetical protein
MLGNRIRIARDLYERLKDAAEQRGYASVGEFVNDILEKAAASAEEETDEELARKQLQGLGYLE